MKERSRHIGEGGEGGSKRQGNQEDSEGIKVSLDEVSHCHCDTWVIGEELVTQGGRETHVCVCVRAWVCVCRKLILILKVKSILCV